MVHQRENRRGRTLQRRQTRRRVEAMGSQRLQELGGNLQGRQEDLVMRDEIKIIDADLSRADHQNAIVAMLDAFMRDPDDDGTPLPEASKRELIPGLRAHPACYVLLAYRGDDAVGFSICFLGFSTFNAR